MTEEDIAAKQSLTHIELNLVVQGSEISGAYTTNPYGTGSYRPQMATKGVCSQDKTHVFTLPGSDTVADCCNGNADLSAQEHCELKQEAVCLDVGVCGKDYGEPRRASSELSNLLAQIANRSRQ